MRRNTGAHNSGQARVRTIFFGQGFQVFKSYAGYNNYLVLIANTSRLFDVPTVTFVYSMLITRIKTTGCGYKNIIETLIIFLQFRRRFEPLNSPICVRACTRTTAGAIGQDGIENGLVRRAVT